MFRKKSQKLSFIWVWSISEHLAWTQPEKQLPSSCPGSPIRNPAFLELQRSNQKLKQQENLPLTSLLLQLKASTAGALKTALRITIACLDPILWTIQSYLTMGLLVKKRKLWDTRRDWLLSSFKSAKQRICSLADHHSNEYFPSPAKAVKAKLVGALASINTRAWNVDGALLLKTGLGENGGLHKVNWLRWK